MPTSRRLHLFCFLSPPLDPSPSSPRRVSEVSASTLRDMNPLIDVHVLGGDVEDVDLEGFVVVVATGLPLASVAALDERCRARGVAFFAADCHAWIGWAFADLGERSWVDEVRRARGGIRPAAGIDWDPF